MNIVVVAVGAATIFLTAGSSAGAQQKVLETIDAAGTRAVTITAPLSAGLDSGIVARLSGIEGIAWVGAFGPARDVTNANRQGGEPVAARDMWSTDFTIAGIERVGVPGSWSSEGASRTLGFAQEIGAVRSVSGQTLPVRGTMMLPEFLSSLDPLVVTPADQDQLGPVTLLVVLASKPEQVAAVSDFALSMTAVSDPSVLRVKTSEELAVLRAAIDTNLGDFGREIVVGSVVATGAVVSCLLIGFVMVRRRDFGRRRALGARRKFIVLLIALQSCLTSLLGAVLGMVASTAVLQLMRSPAPPVYFSIAVCVLLIAAAVVASVPPSLIAANRDPAAELRVP